MFFSCRSVARRLMQSVKVTPLGELCKAVGDDCPTVITRVMEEFNPYFADVKLSRCIGASSFIVIGTEQQL